MKIDYASGRVISKTVTFNGETEDGRQFTINANWNDWDGWNVLRDEIDWDNNDGTDEESDEIALEFENEMN
jgi:hypothetical protein